MNSVLQQFLVGKEEHNTYRFCEKEFQQDEDFGIRVTANTERVLPITYEAKRGLTQKATASEVQQLGSVTKSLAWIARETRPDLPYFIFKIQSTFANACLQDLRECNRSVVYAVSASTRGIYFSPDFFLGRCSCCVSRTRTSRWHHSEFHITTSLYHSIGAG